MFSSRSCHSDTVRWTNWDEGVFIHAVLLASGFRDWVPKELQRVGCVELLNTVQRRVRPKLHVYGGIHEGETQNSHNTQFPVRSAVVPPLFLCVSTQNISQCTEMVWFPQILHPEGNYFHITTQSKVCYSASSTEMTVFLLLMINSMLFNGL